MNCSGNHPVSLRLLAPGLAALCLFTGACASKNVNPATAHTHTGYADLYVELDDPLCWDVEHATGTSSSFSKMFYEFDPVEGNILRLALAPGRHSLRITYLNRVVTRPGQVAVEIRNGMITPVLVTLVPEGSTAVQTREARVGGTMYGRYGRGTKIRATQSVNYQVDTEPQAPLPYQPKARMPYAVAPATNSTP